MPRDTHEENAQSHWGIGGNTYEHTITESDGTTYTGWGWSADEAASNAQQEHDRDGR